MGLLRSAYFRSIALGALLFGFFSAVFSSAQTYTVLHNFTGFEDGGNPYAGLTLDRAGNLYGAAAGGGGDLGRGSGVIFKMQRRGSGWIFTPLYTFAGGSDGAGPESRLIFGANGSLYGATYHGGTNQAGVVFSLKPPQHISGNLIQPWTETVLYAFRGAPDGANPWGDVIFDSHGNLYGTTVGGGLQCAHGYYCGTVYQLTGSGNNWIESLLYTFSVSELSIPRAGVTIDGAGNLYGTISNGNSAVFELTPSGSGWSESTVYQFTGGTDGYGADADLIADPAGNYYTTTVYGGANNQGAVVELTPGDSGWTDQVLYSLGGEGGSQPMAGLLRDDAGNLYGSTCYGAAHNRGAIFKLTPSGGGQWTETTLHEFSGIDGNCPHGSLILDQAGNIYGTAGGGLYGPGVVFEITP